MANYLEQSLAKLKEFEGCVPWMYRDTAGKVTVGVGLMLPDVDAALALQFLSGAHAATPNEIAADFARVDTMTIGRPPSFYKVPGALELAQQTIDAKLSAVLDVFEADLKTQLPYYEGLPDNVKMALLDMIYNLGPECLFKGFPHLMASVETGAWAQAAANCTRRGPSGARNAWTRAQFLSAVVTTIKAETESWMIRIWQRLRLMMSRQFGRRR